MSLRSTIIVAAVLGVAHTGYSAPPHAASRVATAQTPEFFWRSSCGYCHDREAFAPRLLGRHVAAAVTARVVRTGAAGMPPFHASEISDVELTNLARWIAGSKAPGEPQ